MALTVDVLKAHLNITGNDDNAVLTRLLAAATKHVERILGYALNDEEKLPGGAPADLEQAVLMVAGHWYENREAVLVGVAAQEIPFGAAQIIGEYREYSFG
jgi:hypothetical protein